MKLVAGTGKPHARRPLQRFDITKLRGSVADIRGRRTVRGLFRSRVAESLKQEWKEDEPTEVKWSKMKAALCDSAGSTLAI